MADERITENNDTQFMNTLEACLKAEIAALNDILAERTGIIHKIQADVAWKWKEAKNMDEKIKNCRTNIEFTTTILNSLKKHNFNLESQLDLMRVNLDDGFRVMSQEVAQYEQILQQYENTWKLYQAQYEEAPLAKARSEAKTNLEKLHIKEMVLDCKQKELTKRIQQSQRLSWLGLRSKIVEFAEVMWENGELTRSLLVQRENIKKSKEEYYTVNAELEFEKKILEDEDKMRSQQLLEMPPPKMHLPLCRKNYTKQIESTTIGEQWLNKCKQSSDSLSISLTGSIYAEIEHQEECSSTQSLEPEATKFKKLISNSQRSDSNLRRMIPSEIPTEIVDLAGEEKENEVIVIDEQDTSDSAQMVHEPEGRKNIPVFDLDSPPVEVMRTRKEKEKTEPKRVHEPEGKRNIPVFDLDSQPVEVMRTRKEKEKTEPKRVQSVVKQMELESAMKRMKMTLNQETKDINSQDSPCSTIKAYKWEGSKDRKTLFGPNVDTSERTVRPGKLRVASVETVHLDLFSKLGRQNTAPSIAPDDAPLPYSSRHHYCESEAISGVEELANMADEGSMCAGSIAEFSGCTNISPPFSMMSEKDMSGSMAIGSSAQANKQKSNVPAFSFACPNDKPTTNKRFPLF